MNELLLHQATECQLAAFCARPAHALLLAGPSGSGKAALARQLAAQLLELDQQTFENYGYKLIIKSEDGKAISIEAIRELEHFLSLKVPRHAAYNRAVIIEDAQIMTLEAQNAFLKNLEEPPAHTLLILTAAHEQALLPTIRSRLQTVCVKTPDLAAAQDYFAARGFVESDIKRAYAMSGGLIGLMRALLEADDHPLLAAAEQARTLLQASAFERLTLADQLSKDQASLSAILFILQQMAELSLTRAQGAAGARWQRILEASYAADEALTAHAQAKLVVTNLLLQL